MPKVATSLFELAPGVSLPSDADLRAVDAASEMAVKLKEMLANVDTLFFALKFLDAESKLAVARRVAGALNGTTRMFNVAIFIRDKEQESGEDLFAEPVRIDEMELL